MRHASPIARNAEFYVPTTPNTPSDMMRKRSSDVHEDSRVDVKATPRTLSLVASGEHTQVFWPKMRVKRLQNSSRPFRSPRRTRWSRRNDRIMRSKACLYAFGDAFLRAKLCFGVF